MSREHKASGDQMTHVVLAWLVDDAEILDSVWLAS